jgi:uncharacterized OsmC-like protein
MADTFEVRLSRLTGYQFRTEFGAPGVPALLVDEPAPLGRGAGPNPGRLLAAAVGSCLSASLVYCLSKARVEIDAIATKVVGTYRRNERGRLRIGSLAVSIQLSVPSSGSDSLTPCLQDFEDYCVVTASVRQGIEVRVEITDPHGRMLYSNPGPPQT